MMFAKYLVSLLILLVVACLVCSTLPVVTRAHLSAGTAVDETWKIEFTLDCPAAGKASYYIVDDHVKRDLQKGIAFVGSGPIHVISVATEITPKEVSWKVGKTRYTAPGAAMVAHVRWETPADSADGARGDIHIEFPKVRGTPAFHSGAYQKIGDRWIFREVTTYRNSLSLNLARFLFALAIALPIAIVLHSIWWALVLWKEKRVRLEELAPSNPEALPRTFYPNPIAEWIGWTITVSILGALGCLFAGIEIANGFMSSIFYWVIVIMQGSGAVIGLIVALIVRANVLTVQVSDDTISCAKAAASFPTGSPPAGQNYRASSTNGGRTAAPRLIGWRSSSPRAKSARCMMPRPAKRLWHSTPATSRAASGLSIYPPPLGLPQRSGGLVTRNAASRAPFAVFFLFSAADHGKTLLTAGRAGKKGKKRRTAFEGRPIVVNPALRWGKPGRGETPFSAKSTDRGSALAFSMMFPVRPGVAMTMSMGMSMAFMAAMVLGFGVLDRLGVLDPMMGLARPAVLAGMMRRGMVPAGMICANRAGMPADGTGMPSRRHSRAKRRVGGASRFANTSRSAMAASNTRPTDKRSESQTRCCRNSGCTPREIRPGSPGRRGWCPSTGRSGSPVACSGSRGRPGIRPNSGNRRGSCRARQTPAGATSVAAHRGEAARQRPDIPAPSPNRAGKSKSQPPTQTLFLTSLHSLMREKNDRHRARWLHDRGNLLPHTARGICMGKADERYRASSAPPRST